MTNYIYQTTFSLMQSMPFNEETTRHLLMLANRHAWTTNYFQAYNYASGIKFRQINNNLKLNFVRLTYDPQKSSFTLVTKTPKKLTKDETQQIEIYFKNFLAVSSLYVTDKDNKLNHDLETDLMHDPRATWETLRAICNLKFETSLT